MWKGPSSFDLVTMMKLVLKSLVFGLLASLVLSKEEATIQEVGRDGKCI